MAVVATLVTLRLPVFLSALIPSQSRNDDATKSETESTCLLRLDTVPGQTYKSSRVAPGAGFFRRCATHHTEFLSLAFLPTPRLSAVVIHRTPQNTL